MIENLKPIEQVISKIIRDLGIDYKINDSDFIEWISEALRFIDSYNMFEICEAIIPIVGYKGKLPCNYYKGVKIVNHQELRNSDIVDQYIKGYYTLEYLNQPYYYTNKLYLNGELGVYINENKISNLDYRIEFNNIKTSFEHGLIRVQYISIPIDERGYPLIPDNVSVDTALFWYVAKMLRMQGKLNNPELTFIVCNQMWDKYCGQARATCNMPSPEKIKKMGSMFNSYNKSISHVIN